MRVGLALAIALVGCASAPKPTPAEVPACPPAPTAAAPAQAPLAPQESLVGYAPANAIGVVVLRGRALALARRYLAENPELQAELSKHLEDTLGIDFSRVEGVVAHASAIAPPTGAALLRMPPDARPIRLPEAARFGDTPIY